MGQPSATIVPISSLCRLKLDPNALIKERYVGILTAILVQSRWRRDGNIAIRHLEYRAESGVPSRSTVIRTFIAVLAVALGFTGRGERQYRCAARWHSCGPRRTIDLPSSAIDREPRAPPKIPGLSAVALAASFWALPPESVNYRDNNL
jgi:hypothetical protein